MSIPSIVLLVLAGIGIFTVVIALVLPSKQTQSEVAINRLEMYLDKSTTGGVAVEQPGASTPMNVLQKIRDALGALEDEHDEGNEDDELMDKLSRADVPLRKYEWYASLVGTGVVLAALILLRFAGGNFIFAIIFAAGAGVLVPMFGGNFLLGFLQKKRINKFNRQLGDVVIMLSNGMRAGYSFPQALASVASSSKPPIGTELARSAREVQLGLPMEDVLGRLVERNPSEDLDLMIAAVQLQRLVGGNLAEILDTIASTIRERVRLKDKIRALTAQARISGIIIGVLPIILALFLFVIAPSYFQPMTTQTAGQVMLVVGLIIEGIGFLLIQKITNIKV